MKTLALLLLTVFALVAASVPRAATPLAIKMPDGSVKPLSSYKGKTVVLVFMHTTCPHCQRSVPVFNQLQKDYAAKGVQVLAATINPEASDQLKSFIDTYKPAFPIGLLEHSAAEQFLQLSVMQPLYVPAITIITPQGMIREQHINDEFLKDISASTRASLDSLLSSHRAAR